MMKSTLYLFGQFSSIRTLPRNIGLRILLWREKGPVLRRLFIFFLARTAHGVFQLLDIINFHVQKLNDNITHKFRRLISLYPECIFFLRRCTSSSGKFAYRAFSGTIKQRALIIGCHETAVSHLYEVSDKPNNGRGSFLFLLLFWVIVQMRMFGKKH